jgi:hypothetical protein
LVPSGVLCAVAWACLGCGGGKVPVEGAVTLDGQAVEEGTISFEPADGRGPSTGGPIRAGRYRLAGEAGATAGEKVVRIIALRKTGRMVPVGTPAPTGALMEEVVQCVPARYNTRSELKVSVTPGRTNTHDFDLKSGGKPR